jgi:hypothetical protein
MAKAKDLGGRPTEYDPEFVAQAKKLAKLGATDIEIADFFMVSVRTLYRWKNIYPRFCQSLKAGKSQADDRVERALYQRATGFEHRAVKIIASKTGVQKVSYREFVVPDTTACIFWLKNRREKEWRDKSQHEHSGTVTLEDLVCGETKADD